MAGGDTPQKWATFATTATRGVSANASATVCCRCRCCVAGCSWHKRQLCVQHVCPSRCMCVCVCVWITRERGMFLAIFHFRGGKTTCQLSQVAVVVVAVGTAQVAQVARGHLEWVSCRQHVAVAVTVVPACCWTCCWARCGRCECGDKAPNVQQACAGSQ